MRYGAEQRLVQQFVAQPTIEAAVAPVLLRLVRRDAVLNHAGVFGSGHDGAGRTFRAVVADGLSGCPFLLRDVVTTLKRPA